MSRGIQLKTLLAASIIAGYSASFANAETVFKYAFQGSLKSLDPYSLNETFTLGTLGNVYEGLTKRDPDLQIQPALAESWEVIEPKRWRFKLRQGVTFHNGNAFTVDDVLFSADRVRSEGSNLRSRIPDDAVFEKVDDYTFDVVLTSPNPILHHEWDTWLILDKEWVEAKDSVEVISASDEASTAISLESNGTGPFKIVSHEADVKTVFEANPDWWSASNEPHKIDRAEFFPIASDSTRVAALLSGEMDLIYPLPVQDIDRIENNPTTKALIGPELRTIFLGMDQMRDELLHSDVKGKNPFKDVRVRRAFYHAIDIDAIKLKIMRGLSEPSALMLSPLMFDNADQFSRLDHDPEHAKVLLSEAGYPEGFGVAMDCPNDRYVNDESICQAIVSMLAQIGVKVTLNSQPKTQYFSKVLASGGYDTSFYLMGWMPGSFDSWNILSNLHKCHDEEGKGGHFNLGGYCNEYVDALARQIMVENDPSARLDLITQAYRITTDEVAYIPLHQQGLAWGVSNAVEVVQRADNHLMLYRVRKN